MLALKMVYVNSKTNLRDYLLGSGSILGGVTAKKISLLNSVLELPS